MSAERAVRVSMVMHASDVYVEANPGNVQMLHRQQSPPSQSQQLFLPRFARDALPCKH